METYSVDLASGITDDFFENIRQFAGENLHIQKRITESAIELLQNIKKHGLTADPAMLLIKKIDSHFSMEAYNEIYSKDVIELKERISYINTLDHAQVKKEHTQILRKARLSEKSGAGLGLYRIAMRAQSALVASFNQTNQDHSIFTLHVNFAT